MQWWYPCECRLVLGTGQVTQVSHIHLLSDFCSGYSRYRRTKKLPSSKAPASSTASSVSRSTGGTQGAAGKLGMMALPKPKFRSFLQPSYSIL